MESGVMRKIYFSNTGIVVFSTFFLLSHLKRAKINHNNVINKESFIMKLYLISFVFLAPYLTHFQPANILNSV